MSLSMYPDFAKQAREEGLEELAKIFDMVGAVEKRTNANSWKHMPNLPFKTVQLLSSHRQRRWRNNWKMKRFPNPRHTVVCSAATSLTLLWMFVHCAKQLALLNEIIKTKSKRAIRPAF